MKRKTHTCAVPGCKTPIWADSASLMCPKHMHTKALCQCQSCIQSGRSIKRASDAKPMVPRAKVKQVTVSAGEGAVRVLAKVSLPLAPWERAG